MWRPMDSWDTGLCPYGLRFQCCCFSNPPQGPGGALCHSIFRLVGLVLLPLYPLCSGPPNAEMRMRVSIKAIRCAPKTKQKYRAHEVTQISWTDALNYHFDRNYLKWDLWESKLLWMNRVHILKKYFSLYPIAPEKNCWFSVAQERDHWKKEAIFPPSQRQSQTQNSSWTFLSA